MRGRRFLAILLVAGMVSVAPSVPARATPLPTFDRRPDAASFFVDHEARTINVTVRLMFMGRSCLPGSLCRLDPALARRLLDQAARRIVEGIERFWQGHTYRCYKLVFHINATIGSIPQDAGPNRFVIRLEDSGAWFRSFVQSVEVGDDPLGNDPADRVVPGNDISNLSTWYMYDRDSTYAHEFGHVLGLDDGYDPATNTPLEGAPLDLMSEPWTAPKVSQDMVDRVVERSGQVRLDELRCDYRVEYKAAWKYAGVKCDGPAGRWVIDIAVGPASGTVTIQLDRESLTGPATSTYAIGQVATYELSGKARFHHGNPPTLVIDHGTGTFSGTFGGGSVAGGKVSIPLEVGSFC